MQKGFRFSKIVPSYSLFSTWEEEEDFFENKAQGIYYLAENKNIQELETLFSKGFSFLGRGQQCFAFLSEDQEYVIKFIRQDKLREKPWLYLPIFSGKEKIEARRQALENIKRSLFFVKEELAEDNGVVCIHMGKTKNFPRKTFLKDPLGRKKEISLNETYFVIQKKARPLEEALKKASPQQIRKITESLFFSVVERAKKKIRNKNRRCLQNMGLIEGKGIDIDLAEFFKKEEVDASFIYIETAKSLRQYQKFLEKRDKKEALFLQEKLKNLEEMYAKKD